jgi:hypothetical protein
MAAPVPYFYYNFEANTINGLNLANRGTGLSGTAGTYDASLSSPYLCFQSDYRIANQQATFNGNTSEYVTLPAFTSTTDDLTFCFWFRTYGCTHWARIFDFSTKAPGSGGGDNIILGLNTTGSANGAAATSSGRGGEGVNFTTAIYFGGTQSGQEYVNTINIGDNVWRHFAWTISGTAGQTGTFSFYLNGQFLYSTTGKVPNKNILRTNNYICRSATTTDPAFNGAIDEFQMYKSALTSAQIAAIYNGTVASYSVSPSIYANYNDGKNNQMLATTSVSTTGLTHHYTFDSATVGGGPFGATNLQNVATGLYDASLSNMSLISTNYFNGAFSTTGTSNYSKPLTARYVTGNGALTMDASGYSGFVTINSTVAATPTNTSGNGLTFCFWLRSAGNTDFARVFELGNGWKNNNIVCNVEQSVLAFYVNQGEGTSEVTVNAIHDINDNVWRHITWTITSTGSGQIAIWSFFVNGLLVNTSYNVANGYPASIARSTNYIGKSAATVPPFDGGVDDFRKYDRVLTAAEIAQIGQLNPLYFHYSFDPSTVNGSAFDPSTVNGSALANMATGTASYDAKLTVNNFTASTGSTYTPNTSSATTASWTNNSITWTATTNDVFAGSAQQAFNPTNTQGWLSLGPYNTTSPGAYTGSVSTVISTVGTILGDWLQIQSSTPVSLLNYSFTTQSSVIVNINALPRVFYIVGSNNGSTWYPIQNTTFTSLPVASPSSSSQQTTGTYLNNSIGGTNTQLAASINSYITSSTTYSYFRIIVTNVLTNSFSITNTNTAPRTNFLWNVQFGTLLPVYPINSNDYKVGSASLSLNNRPLNAYPPAAMTSNSTTLTGYSYGNGLYETSASSFFFDSANPSNSKQTLFPYNAFSKTVADSSHWPAYSWTPSTFNYNGGATPYRTYGGTASTNIISGGITTAYKGEWLQIKMPTSIAVQYYIIQAFSPRGPSIFVIAGSNDGSNWSMLDYQDVGSSWNTADTMQSITFSIQNNYISYQYYRFVQITSNRDVWGGINELVFYGTSELPQYVQLPSFWTGNNGLTFACWFKSNNNQTHARLFDFGCGGASGFRSLNNNADGNKNIIASIVSGNLRCQTCDGNSSNYAFNTAFQLNDNVWRHMAWTMATDGTWKVYINGQMTNMELKKYPDNVLRYFNYIGKSNLQADPYFSGGIDDFRMYKSVLSDSEIQALYKGSTLAIHYPFDADKINGSAIEDLVGTPARLKTGVIAVSPNNLLATAASWTTPEGITWKASASPEAGGAGHQAFNSIYGASAWVTASSRYNGGTGVYIGSVTTTVSGIGTVNGEWLQIQSSIPIQFTSHNLTNYYDATNTFYSYHTPKNYYIVGSTDGTTWVPIQLINYLANSTKPTTPDGSHITRTIQTTTNTVKATYGLGIGSCEVTGYATSLNYYSYFRLIVVTLIGNPSNTTETRCVLGNWNISALTQNSSLTSSILLGNLDSGITTPCSIGGASSIGYSYPMNYWICNNITWIVTSSSSYEESTYSTISGNTIDYRWHPFYAFLGTIPSNGDYSWVSGASPYNTSTGEYDLPTPASTIVQSPLSLTVNGEWIQITSSVPVQMISHSLIGRYQRQQEMPISYYIVGSNDNTTWYPVQRVVRTGGNKGAVPGLDVNTTTPTARLKTAINSYIDVTAGFTSVVTGYSTSTNMYTNFRLITTKIATNGSSLVSLSQWYITVTTNKVSTTNYATGTGSLLLDGNYGQCVSIPNYQFKDRGISIATWFNITTIPANVGSFSSTLFDFGNGWINNNVICYFQGTSLKFGVWNGLGATTNGIAATTIPVYQTDKLLISTVTPAIWYHIAITISTSGTWQFYVNGQLTGTYTNYPYPYDIRRDVNFIGRSSNSANPAFSGYIDDFRVYKSVISQAKIGSLYALRNTSELVSTASEGAVGYSQLTNDLSQLYKRNYSYMGGVISTIAGTGVSGYSGDGVLATQAKINCCQDIALDSSNNLFIADFHNERIRRIDAVTGIITTICGNGSKASSTSTSTGIGDGGLATNATINNPNDIFIDPGNNIYFTEYQGARIRKITAVNGQYSTSSTISTICGGSAATNSESSSGNLATATKILLPYGLFIDASSNIYFVQDSIAGTNAYIRKITTSTGILTNILGTGVGNASSAAGLAGLSTTYNRCCGVVVDTNLNVYYIDTNGCMVRKMPYSNGSYGNIVTLAGTSGTSSYTGDGGLAVNATLNSVNGIAIDGSNNLYICSGNTVRTINQQTGIISTIAGGVAAAYTGDGGLSVNALLNLPFRIKLDSYGNLYLSDRENNVVRKITRQGLLSNLATGFQINGQDINTLYSPQISTITTAQNNVTGFLTNSKALPNFESTIHKAIPVPGYQFTSNNGYGTSITSGLAFQIYNSYIRDTNGGIITPVSDSNFFYNLTYSNYLTRGTTGLAYQTAGVATNLTSIDEATNNIITYLGNSSNYNNGQYTIIWKGYFLANYTGTWTFSTNNTDDFTVLFVNGSRLIFSTILTNTVGSSQSMSATISLIAGTSYPISIYYVNGVGAGNLQVGWSNPTLSFTTNGAGYLFTSSPNDNNGLGLPITNNSFESSNSVIGISDSVYSLPTGWSSAAGSGVVLIGYQNTAWGGPYTPLSGSYFCGLQNSGTTISQSINIPSAGSYYVVFGACTRNGNGTSSTIQVSLGGTVILTQVLNSYVMTTYTSSSSVYFSSAGTQTLTLTNTSSAGDITCLVDFVNVFLSAGQTVTVTNGSFESVGATSNIGNAVYSVPTGWTTTSTGAVVLIGYQTPSWGGPYTPLSGSYFCGLQEQNANISQSITIPSAGSYYVVVGACTRILNNTPGILQVSLGGKVILTQTLNNYAMITFTTASVYLLAGSQTLTLTNVLVPGDVTCLIDFVNVLPQNWIITSSSAATATPNDAYNAFNGSINDYWLDANGNYSPHTGSYQNNGLKYTIFDGQPIESTVVNTTSYRYYKLDFFSTQTAADGFLQFNDWQFFNSTSTSGATLITCPTNEASYKTNFGGPSSSTVQPGFDGSNGSKFCMLRPGGATGSALLNPVGYVIIDFGTANIIKSYGWYTANDRINTRDPTEWTLYGSNDLNWSTLVGTWTSLSSVVGFGPTAERNTFVGSWTIYTKSISAGTSLYTGVSTVTGFSTNLSSYIAASNNTLTTSTNPQVTSQVNFTMVFNGYFLSDYTGVWTFRTTSIDDYVYLWIGPTAVPGSSTGLNSLFRGDTGTPNLKATISLVSGTYYPIQILVGNGGGPGNFNISWSINNSTFTSVGTGYLFNAIPNTIANYITPCINNTGIIDTNYNYLLTSYPEFIPGSTTGIAVGANNSRMVLSSWVFNNAKTASTSYLYYSTSSDNGVTWSTPTMFLTVSLSQNVQSIALTSDGTRGVYPSGNNAGCYWFSWPFGQSAPNTTSTQVGDVATTRSYLGVALTADGIRLVASSLNNTGIYISTWNGTTYTTLTQLPNITTGNYIYIGLSQDGTRLGLPLVNGTVTISLWNGTTYSAPIACSDIGSRTNRTFVFSKDMNTMYVSVTGQTTYSVFVSHWTGSKYDSFTTIPTTSLVGGLEARIAISSDSNSLYVQTFSDNTSSTTLYKLNVSPFSAGEWLQVQLPYPLQLTEYSLLNPVLYPFDTTPYREPTVWGVMGSNDGQTWYLVDGETTSPTSGGVVRAFPVSNPSSFTYFRLVINKLFANALSTNANLCQWNLNGVYTYTDSNIHITSNYGNVEQLVPSPGFISNSSSSVAKIGTNTDANAANCNAIGFNYNNQSYIVSSSTIHTGPVTTREYNNWPAFRGAQSVNRTVDAISYHSGVLTSTTAMTSFYGGRENEMTAPIGTLTTEVLAAQYKTGGLAVNADNTVIVYCNYADKVGYGINTGGKWTNKGAISDSTIRQYIAIALTNDGNRLLTLVSGGLAYYAVWTGSTYGTLIPTADTTTRGYRGIGMNADGSRVIAVTDSNTVWMATWSTNNYSAFTTIITGTAGNAYTGAAMSQDGTRIAYVDGATGNLYVGYWTGTTYSSGIVINNTSSLFSSFANNSSSRNLGFSKDKNILYLSTYAPQTKGSYSLFAAYYNNATQKYGNFYPNTALTSNRDGWGMCVSPDGNTIWLADMKDSGSFSNVSTLQYTVKGEWLQIQLAKPAKLTSYGFLPRLGLSVRVPKKFLLLGSNDGQTWYLVDANNELSTDNITRSNISTGAQTSSYVPPFGDSTLVTYGPSTTYACNFYSYYRIVTIEIYMSGQNTVNIGQVVMRGVYL